ncbi:transposase [Streptomyces katrae]|uniref:transposase n=1 Tax=Streptomyces katrae TaxID=68223 RepID=UPI003AF09135
MPGVPERRLFELCDALLCTEGPVRTLVDLALAPEHRRGHGALYFGLNQGRMDVARLRRALADVLLLRAEVAVVTATETDRHGRRPPRRGTDCTPG